MPSAPVPTAPPGHDPGTSIQVIHENSLKSSGPAVLWVDELAIRAAAGLFSEQACHHRISAHIQHGYHPGLFRFQDHPSFSRWALNAAILAGSIAGACASGFISMVAVASVCCIVVILDSLNARLMGVLLRMDFRSARPPVLEAVFSHGGRDLLPQMDHQLVVHQDPQVHPAVGI